MSASEDAVRVVLITAPDRDTGTALARALVGEKLAACVNLVPGIRSIYRWEGEVEEGDEVLMVVKTRAARCEALAARVRDLHPYDVPEVIEMPVEGGSPAYLDWVRTESRA